MIPILYNVDERNFNHRGLGALNGLLEYKITEELNGQFDAVFEYPVAGDMYQYIEDFMLIKAVPNRHDEPHVFRIYETELDIERQTLMIYARSNIYDLAGNMVRHTGVKDMTPTEAWRNAVSASIDPVDVTFDSTITTPSSTTWTRRNLLSCIVGEQGSMLQIWGGELKYGNKKIWLYRRRGDDNVTTIRYGKNLAGLKATYSTKGVVTAILPYFNYRDDKSGEEKVITGDVVKSDLVNSYPYVLYEAVEYNEDDGVTDSESLNRVASRYFKDYPDKDKPSINMEVNLLDLSHTKEYEKFKDLEQVKLGDTVTVYAKKFGVNITAKVNKITYNGLTEENEVIEIGATRASQYDNYRELIDRTVDKSVQPIKEQLNIVQISASGKNRVFRGPQEPTEGMIEGDLWFKELGSGEREMYIYNGWTWGDPIDFDEANRKVAHLEEQLEEFEKDLTSTTELANNVSEKASQLEQNYQDVKASLEDGEVFKEEVIRDFNSVTERLSLIDGANGYINEIKRDVGSLTSSITEYEEGTAKRFNVIESDVKGTKQSVSDLENETSSQFNVMSDEISAVVGKVNNIGGRNLIRNSNDMEWLPNGDSTVNVSDSSQLKNGQFVMATGGKYDIKTYQEFTDKTDTIIGETYTFSMTVYNGSLNPLTFELYGLDPLTSQTVNYQETKRITFTGERDIYFLDLRVMVKEIKDNAYFHVVNPKLEKGEVATDWSPAPEDGVSKNELISEINVQADRQIFRVGDNRLMITEDSTYFDNAVIKSAHIADLAVTGAKIADASISSAKIISLDADQITGNTTNFIKSNWNNISTQISIDDRGINVTGSDRWRRTYFNQTGFELFNGSGAYNKAGVIGYFKPNTDVADAYENVMQRGGSRHSIGIGVGESHDLTFGWTNTRANSQVHTPAMIFNSEYKRIELNSSLNAPASTHGIVLNSEQHRGDYGVQLRWNNNFRSRLVLADNTYLEARNQIHFYNYSGSRAFSMGQNNDSWLNLNMHGNSITNQSDERLKRNIIPSSKDSLGRFNKVKFKWFEYLPGHDLAEGLHHGLIAQEVLKFAPEWVIKEDDGYYTLDQSVMLMDAFKAIQQLSQKVKKLEAM